MSKSSTVFFYRFTKRFGGNMKALQMVGKKSVTLLGVFGAVLVWLVVPGMIEKAFEGSQSINSPAPMVTSATSGALSHIKARWEEFQELQFTTPPARELVSAEVQRLKLGDEQGAPKERAYMETLRSEDRRMK